MSRFRELMESLLKENSEWVVVVTDDGGSFYVTKEDGRISGDFDLAKKFSSREEAEEFLRQSFEMPRDFDIVNSETGIVTKGNAFVFDYNELIKHMR